VVPQDTAGMALRKTKEQRDALRAELERQDREHSARLAAVSAQARRPALFCQQCEAKLKPEAATCHYCGSGDLGTSQPSCPRFSDVAVDGACPRCHGTSFKTVDVVGTMAAGGLLAGGTVGAAIGAMAGAMAPDDVILCVTCGARFRRG
jgi:Zn finger protein HypA/HybF involved in hydrogenase expression